MLTPNQIDNYANAATKMFEPLANSILGDMARRIQKANYMTSSAKWQAERAKALGASTQYLMQQMARLNFLVTPQAAKIFVDAMLLSDQQDAAIYQAAGREYVPIGSNAAVQQLLNSGFRRTMNTLENLTQTRAVMDNKNFPQTQQIQLTRLLDLAHTKAASGAFSADAAVRNAIRNLADQGLDMITYPSGRTDRFETVVLRALRTGINQTAGDISLHNAMMMGCDLMELSAHSGARVGDGHPDLTNHSWWQGKLVSLSGKEGCLTLEDIGYGDVRGFMGANCRHNWYPFFPGASVRNWTEDQLEELNAPNISYNGQMITEAQADEKQRAMERSIRKYKREYLLFGETGMTEDQQTAAVKLNAARRILDDFLGQTGRKQQQLRETVPGFGRSAAGKATWTAKKK